MTLLTRIGRLFSADVHSIIDQLEDPEAILKQSIREMQQLIEQSQSRIQELQQCLEHSAATEQQLRDNLTSFAPRLDLAFADNNEALIKSLLAKRLETERWLKTTETESQRLTKQLSDRQNQRDEQQEKLDAVIEKLNLFCGQKLQDWRSEHRDDNVDLYVSKEEIELAYLQEKQRRENAGDRHPTTE